MKYQISYVPPRDHYALGAREVLGATNPEESLYFLINTPYGLYLSMLIHTTGDRYPLVDGLA
jgi:hypothetical protein